MDAAAPTGGNLARKRRWGWISLLFVLPAVALLVVNLALASPWSCRWLATRIERRCGGLEARVGSVSVTPWSGISISQLEILQPPPLRSAVKGALLHVDRLRVAPVWHAWLRGRLEIHNIALDTPRVVLPIELISHLAKAGPPQQPAPPPSTAPAGQPPTEVPPVAATQPATPPATAPEAAKPTVPVPKLPPVPTGWLHVSNASFAIVRTGLSEPLMEFSNTNGSIPVAGDPAVSVLKIGSISSVGNQLGADVSAALLWTRPQLALKPMEAEVGGYKFQFAAQLALFSGLPLQIEAALPGQAFKPIPLPFDGEASAEGVNANARFRGLLLAPASWQGDFVAQSTAPVVKAAGQEAKFDRANLITVLRGGVLSCVDARLISDQLSVLGNATLLADGRLAGVARLVASPETTTAIVGKVFPDNLGSPILTQLSTPQRTAFDLEAFGNIGQIFLRLGKEGPILNLHP